MGNYLERLPLALFSGYVIKLLILGANYQDALVILVLATLYAYSQHKTNEAQFVELKQELKLLKNDIAIVKNTADDVKTSVVGMKLNQGIRTVSGIK